MVRGSIPSLQLYPNAYHIIFANRKEAINKMEFNICSLLDTSKRPRLKYIEVTCTFFPPLVSRAIEKNVEIKKIRRTLKNLGNIFCDFVKWMKTTVYLCVGLTEKE